MHYLPFCFQYPALHFFPFAQVDQTTQPFDVLLATMLHATQLCLKPRLSLLPPVAPAPYSSPPPPGHGGSRHFTVPKAMITTAPVTGLLLLREQKKRKKMRVKMAVVNQRRDRLPCAFCVFFCSFGRGCTTKSTRAGMPLFCHCAIALNSHLDLAPSFIISSADCGIGQCLHSFSGLCLDEETFDHEETEEDARNGL